MPYELLPPESATPAGRYEMLPPEAQGDGDTRPPLTGIFNAAGARQLASNAGNLAAGFVRGAGSIGATLLAPIDAAARKLNGGQPINIGGYDIAGQDRRAGMDAALQSMGADSNSMQFFAGKLGAEVAGTAGVGNAVALPIRAAAQALPAISRVAGPLASSIESGGFNLGTKLPLLASVPTRAIGGAINGGLSAGLVNPDDAATGAKIGGALPVVGQAVGKTAQAVGNAYRNATTPQEVKVAQSLAQQLGVNAGDLTAAVTGPQLIPGYVPTVPQIVQNPAASQLQRTLQTAGHQNIADAVAVQQSQFRDALSRVAPVAPTVNDAANRAGNAISGFAIPAQRQATQNVRSLFQAIPDAEATMQLPLQEMQNAQTRFVGPGTFGKGNGLVEQAMRTATHIGTNPLSPLEAQTVPFSQLQALRSSIGETIGQAEAGGHNQAAAALTAMKNAIDNKVADVASGNALPGEVFTPEAIDTWGQALAAHQAKMQQFHTGPQASMFRNGADGQPAIQGAEIPGKFYNGNRSQIEDAQSFRRLIGNREDLANELKSYAITQGMDTAGRTGNLGQSYVDWLKSRSGANSVLLSPNELATVNEVGKAVQRQIMAEELGRVSGPDTAQKLASLQSNGLLDSKALDSFAHKIPLVKYVSGPVLDFLRSSANQTRGGIQAGLLADPQKFADTLGRAPGLLNFDPAPLGLLTRGVYPALLGQ